MGKFCQFLTELTAGHTIVEEEDGSQVSYDMYGKTLPILQMNTPKIY